VDLSAHAPISLMRIVHVTPYFAPAFVYGGPPRSILGLCRALRRTGADIAVVTTSANGAADLPAAVTERSTFEDVPVTYLPRSFPKRDFRSAALGGALDTVAAGCDLVHVHGCWNFFGWTAAQWCWQRRVPYVLSPRGMLYPWSFRQGRWVRKQLSYALFERPTLGRARCIHATSMQEAAVVTALRLGNEVMVVPNGLDDLDEAQPPRSDAFRARFGVEPADFLFLFLGRIHPKKGLDTLLPAFRDVAGHTRRAMLLIAGAGEPEYVASLQASARDLIDAGRIVFAGYLTGDDRRLAFASADGFVLTSHSENFGMGVAEAMVAGLPVVVSRECPWPQIEAWRAGLWVENSPASVSHALQTLLNDPAAAHAMGQNGCRQARMHLDWNHLVGDMLQVYARAIGIQ
jgi:glycosyltransferase involved in cell wall biosynthesis